MRLAAVTLIGLSVPLFAAPGTKDKPPLYHATAVGDKLTYEVRSGKRVSEYTDTVTAVEDMRGTLVVTVTRGQEGRRRPADKLSVSAKGLATLADDARDYDPPAVLLPLPVKVGDKWDSTPANPKLGDVTGRDNKVIGEEDVEVPAGTFKAVRVDTKISLSGEQYTVSQWYAPGVGLVKKAGPRGTVVALKKFTPGKK